MTNREEIKTWAQQKTREELEKVIVMLIRNGIDTEDLRFNKFPYCTHSGESLLESDEWEEED